MNLKVKSKKYNDSDVLEAENLETDIVSLVEENIYTGGVISDSIVGTVVDNIENEHEIYESIDTIVSYHYYLFKHTIVFTQFRVYNTSEQQLIVPDNDGRIVVYSVDKKPINTASKLQDLIIKLFNPTLDTDKNILSLREFMLDDSNYEDIFEKCFYTGKYGTWEVYFYSDEEGDKVFSLNKTLTFNFNEVRIASITDNVVGINL